MLRKLWHITQSVIKVLEWWNYLYLKKNEKNALHVTKIQLKRNEKILIIYYKKSNKTDWYGKSERNNHSKNGCRWLEVQLDVYGGCLINLIGLAQEK